MHEFQGLRSRPASSSEIWKKLLNKWLLWRFILRKEMQKTGASTVKTTILSKPRNNRAENRIQEPLCFHYSSVITSISKHQLKYKKKKKEEENDSLFPRSSISLNLDSSAGIPEFIEQTCKETPKSHDQQTRRACLRHHQWQKKFCVFVLLSFLSSLSWLCFLSLFIFMFLFMRPSTVYFNRFFFFLSL